MDKRIGDYLLEDGLVSEEQLDRALELQKQRVLVGDSSPLGAILLEMGMIDEGALETELAKQAQQRVRLYGKESKRE